MWESNGGTALPTFETFALLPVKMGHDALQKNMEKYECLKNMKLANSINQYENQTAFNVRTVEGRIPSIQMFRHRRATAHPAFEMKVFCISRHQSVPDTQALPNKNILASLIFCIGNRTV